MKLQDLRDGARGGMAQRLRGSAGASALPGTRGGAGLSTGAARQELRTPRYEGAGAGLSTGLRGWAGASHSRNHEGHLGAWVSNRSPCRLI